MPIWPRQPLDRRHVALLLDDDALVDRDHTRSGVGDGAVPKFFAVDVDGARELEAEAVHHTTEEGRHGETACLIMAPYHASVSSDSGVREAE